MANKKYTVTAPSGQKISFWGPEGATDDQLIAHAQKQQASGRVRPQAAPKAAPKPKPKPQSRGVFGTITDTAGRYLDSVTMGLGDEWAGVSGAAGHTLGTIAGLAARKQGVTKTDWDNFRPGEAYDEEKAAYQRDQARFQKEHGNLALAADAAGIASAIVAPVGRVIGTVGRGIGMANKVGQTLTKLSRFGTVAPKAGLGARVVGSGKQGLAYGGFSGFASTDGGITDRVRGAVPSALVGGGLGLGIPLIGAGVGATARFARQNATRAGREAAGVEDANEIIGKALDDSHLTPQAASDMLDSRAALQTQPFLADLSDPLRNHVAQAAKPSSPARAAVYEAISKRAHGSQERVQGHIERDLGRPVNIPQHEAALEAGRKAKAGPLYARSNANVVDVDQELYDHVRANPMYKDVLRKAMRNVRDADPSIRSARDKVFTRGMRWKPTQVRPGDLVDPANPPPAGRMVPGLVPKMQVYDEANTVLNDMGQFGGGLMADPVARGTARSARAQGSASRDLIDARNPDWAPARDLYRTRKRLETAFALGKDKAGKMTPDEIRAATAGMSKEEREQFLKGHTASLSGEVAKPGFYAERGRQIVGSPEKQERLGALYGAAKGKRNLGRFLETMDAEQSADLTYKALKGVPGAMDREVGSAGGTIAQAGALMAAGAPSAGGGRILSFIDRTLTTQRQKAASGRLGEALANGDIARVKAILREVGVQKAAIDKITARYNAVVPKIGKGLGVASGLTSRERPDEDDQ